MRLAHPMLEYDGVSQALISRCDHHLWRLILTLFTEVLQFVPELEA